MIDHFSVKILKKFWRPFSWKKFVNEKLTKKKKNSGESPYEIVSFLTVVVVVRPSWSSKFFLHFCRPNTRALCTQVALAGLRPFVSPLKLGITVLVNFNNPLPPPKLEPGWKLWNGFEGGASLILTKNKRNIYEKTVIMNLSVQIVVNVTGMGWIVQIECH